MVAAIVAIIVAILGYFSSKKAGATDAQAAMVGAAAGAGTYYASTQTDWGKQLISRIEDFVGITKPNGDPVLDEDGNPIKVPKGATVVFDKDGNPQRNPDGSILWKLVDEAGNVLTNWGPTGTAGVIGTAGVVGAVRDNPWLWVGGGVLLLALISK